jgi:hypothetical protein
MNLPKKDVARILSSYRKFSGDEIHPHKWSLMEHSDAGWKYIMINWKKLYVVSDDYDFKKHPVAKTCIVLHESEGYIDWITLWRYDWKDFYWIECTYKWWKSYAVTDWWKVKL